MASIAWSLGGRRLYAPRLNDATTDTIIDPGELSHPTPVGDHTRYVWRNNAEPANGILLYVASDAVIIEGLQDSAIVLLAYHDVVVAVRPRKAGWVEEALCAVTRHEDPAAKQCAHVYAHICFSDNPCDVQTTLEKEGVRTKHIANDGKRPTSWTDRQKLIIIVRQA